MRRKGSRMGNASGQAVVVTNLTCEYMVNPLGIDTPHPRLSWMLQSSLRGQRQTAYRVLAAGSEQVLAKDQGDLWDSGKVESARSTHVAYAGGALPSRQQCFWKVKVWDVAGRESP